MSPEKELALMNPKDYENLSTQDYEAYKHLHRTQGMTIHTFNQAKSQKGDIEFAPMLNSFLHAGTNTKYSFDKDESMFLLLNKDREDLIQEGMNPFYRLYYQNTEGKDMQLRYVEKKAGNLYLVERLHNNFQDSSYAPSWFNESRESGIPSGGLRIIRIARK